MERKEWPATVGAAWSFRLRETLRQSGAAVLLDEVANRVDGNGTVGGEKTVVPHLHEATGQDVLEKATDKFQDIEGSSEIEVGAVLSILEGDGAVLHLEDAVIGDGDFEDIGCQVFQ